jgi:phage-related protein
MAKNKQNTIGMSFQADVVDLKNGLKQVKEEITKADKEFAKNTASMDKWANNTEGLGAKLTQLNTKLDSQKKAVQLYQDEIERVSKLEGNHSAELEKLKDKLQSAEIAVKKTEKEISHYSSSLEEVAKQEKEANSELGKLTKTISEQESEVNDLKESYKDAVITYGKNSKEAKALKKEIENLSNELEDNKDQVQFADKQLELLEKQFDDTSDSAEDFSKGIDGIKDLGSKVAGGFAAIGASVAGLATAFLATATETKEFRTNMGKLEAGFETSGLKAEQAAETYKQLFAVVADEGKATEATAMLGQLATSQQDLTKWVNISTGVYATFGDSLPIENLAEAALETSKTGAITGGLADALNWAGISEDKFQESLDACTTEQERQKLITETLNKTYDDASKKYQQVNSDVIESNRAQVELSDTMAQLGEKAEPILTTLKEGFNLLMQEALKLTEDVDFAALSEKIEGAFAYFIDTIIPKIKEGFNWIIDNKDILIAGIVAIGTAMLAWNVVSVVQGVVGAIKGWQAATTGMTTAQALLNTVMSANPIGLVIAAVAGLTAGFVLLWNKSDAFREFWIGLWDKLKSVVGTVVEWIKSNWDTMLLFLMNPVAGVFKYLYENFDGFRNKVDAVVSAVVQFFKDCWSNIKDAWSGVSDWFSNIATNVSDAFKNIPSKIKGFFSDAWVKVKDAWSTVTTFFSDTKDNVIDAFTDLPEKMLDVGKNLVEGLWNGVKDKTDWVVNKIKGFSGDVLGGIKKFFGIHSPSTEMAEIGKFLDEGLAQGIEKNKDTVSKSADKMSESVINSMDSIQNELKNLDAIKLGNKENPFEGWTHAKLNEENEKLSKQLDDINNKIKKNKKTQDEFGVTSENTAEAAELIAKKFETQNKMMEVFNKKLEHYKKYNEEIPEWVEKGYGSLQEQLEETKNEVETVSKCISDCFSNKSVSAIDELKTGFLTFIDNSKTKMSEWQDGWGAVCTSIGNSFQQAASYATDIMGAINDYQKQINANRMADIDAEHQKYCETKDNELTKFNETADLEIQKYQENSNLELQTLQEKFDAGLISEEEYQLGKESLAQKLADQVQKIEDEKLKEQKRIEEEKLANEKKALEEKDKIAREQFEAQKATSIAQALIQGALAIVTGFAQLGPIGGAINAAVQVGLTAAEIATISAQKYVPMLAKGGVVDSPTLAMVGEAGKEVVMPLENNTGWIHELAGKISFILEKDLSFGLNPQMQYMNLQPATVNNYNNFNQTINSPKQLTRREIYRDSKNLLSLRGR